MDRIVQVASPYITPPTVADGDGGDDSTGGLRVFLYHTHLLGWLGKWLLPARWNEGISLQHCKAYLFDDDVLISGANLSET